MDGLGIEYSPTHAPMGGDEERLYASCRRDVAVRVCGHWLDWLSSQILWYEKGMKWLALTVASLFTVAVMSVVCGIGLLSAGAAGEYVALLFIVAAVTSPCVWFCARLGARFQRNADSLQELRRTLVKAQDSVADGSPFSLSFQVPVAQGLEGGHV